MQEVEDEPLFAERVAGIDIAKAEVMVTIRVPADTGNGRRQQETREFRAVRKELLALADWLRSWQVTKVGMEATGDYWKPVYFLLEREGFDCELYHAAQVKALPGRPKTDKLDSAWLAKITERGSLASSFVPPEEIRRLRTHTRYRRHLTQARTAEKARCEKLLEDAHLKLSSVITDIHGVSGRDMLTAIIAGERSPKVLAQMARTRMRGKIRQLEEALDCSFFTEQHAFAETGVDMTVFPTAGHLASWARQAPQVSESAGKRKGKNATGRGNPYIGGALGEAAVNAGRTQTFLGTKYRRLIKRMPKKKAQGAISRTQLIICHALLSDPDAVYTDLGTGYYEERMNIRRQARSHARALERLGYKVTIEAIDPGTGELQPIAS